MAASAHPPDRWLVAVVMVVQTRSQPRLVFHYPPKPGQDNSRFTKLFKSGGNEDASATPSEEYDGSSSAEDLAVGDSTLDQPVSSSPPDIEELDSASPQKGNESHEELTEFQWNDLFGYQASTLARLLCPPASSHKKRVEIGLDNKIFVGQPAYAKPDGAWKTKKCRRTSSQSTAPRTSERESVKSPVGKSEHPDRNAMTDSQDDEPRNGSTVGTLRSHDARKTAGSEIPTAYGDKNTKAPKAPLNMFHVSFVLQPPPLEYHMRVKDIYDNVAKKFTKALRWEQARSEYVATEAALIHSTVKRLNKAIGEPSSFATVDEHC